MIIDQWDAESKMVKAYVNKMNGELSELATFVKFNRGSPKATPSHTRGKGFPVCNERHFSGLCVQIEHRKTCFKSCDKLEILDADLAKVND